jgi:transcriptional regulator of acetoin/glycerol metabolism
MVTGTGTMQRGGTNGPREGKGAARAGLVLLFAEPYESLAPAVVFDGTVTIGRDPPSGGFALPVEAVSRLHARFSTHNGTWVVSDLLSRNGTFVNGKRVERGALAHGDRVRIGDAVFKFVSDRADAYLPYRLDGVVGPPVRPTPQRELLGGLQMDELLAEVERVAASPLHVLVHGETGTGKELVARAVHRASGRAGRLCAVNCAAIPTALLESELFGFKRGAFTGANQDKQGLVRAAHGGTLLLDEIGDMPIEAQAKLLRVIETREVVPLGATAGEKVDIRLVCATHRDLPALVEKGAFRGDLYARLCGYAVYLPPLRDRKEDIYQLACRFSGQAPLAFALMDALLSYDWPYNVRELDTTMRRAVVVADGAPLTVAHLPASMRGETARGETATGPIESATRAANAQGAPTARAAPSTSPSADELRALLARHDGNLAAVARVLGKDRTQIRRWLRQAGIDPDQFR